MKASDRIAEMMLIPHYQDEVWRRFCMHPLAPQIMRQIAAGQSEQGGELVQNTYKKIYQDLVVEEETGVSAESCPWFNEQAI